jgi:hypothetical protein
LTIGENEFELQQQTFNAKLAAHQSRSPMDKFTDFRVLQRRSTAFSTPAFPPV